MGFPAADNINRFLTAGKAVNRHSVRLQHSLRYFKVKINIIHHQRPYFRKLDALQTGLINMLLFNIFEVLQALQAIPADNIIVKIFLPYPHGKC